MSLLVVMGINGRQGSSVANAFLGTPGWRIRGLTSSPLCLSSEKWRALGVEIVGININNEDSIRAAFQDATAIFMVTDYYAHLFDHSVHTIASMTSKPLEAIAGPYEKLSGEMILTAAAAAPRLQRLIWSTIRTKSPPTHRGRMQVQIKVLLVKWMERFLPGLCAKTSFLYPCLRMEDYATMLTRSEDGTLYFGTAAAGSARLPWVNMTKDFGMLARALVFDLPPLQNVAAVSGWLSGFEICGLINQISSLPCSYRRATPTELQRSGDHVMIDIISHTQPYYFFDPAVRAPAQIASRNNIDLPMTSFEDFLLEDLPRRLEELMNQPNLLNAVVFATPFKASEEESQATSEAVEEIGYKASEPNAKGYDRYEFIGNHPMVKRVPKMRKSAQHEEEDILE